MIELTDDSVTAGALYACPLHFFQIIIIVLSFLLPALARYSISAWSLTQFFYLGPAIWFATRGGQRQKAKGIWIVAGIGVLLNGGCDYLLLHVGISG